MKQAYRIIVAIFLAPHECRLEFGELISAKLFTCQDQTDDVLRQQRETAQIEDLVAVLINELENFLHQTFGALVLDVSFGGCQQRAHRVHIDAALHESRASATQLFEPIVIGCIHDAEQSTWLQCYASRVYVFDELTEYIRFKFFNDQRLMLLTCRLHYSHKNKQQRR